MKVGETWVGRDKNLEKEFVVKIKEIGTEPTGEDYVKAVDNYRGPFTSHRKQFVKMYKRDYSENP